MNPEILDFLVSKRDEVDVFCFQEMMRVTGDDEFDPLFDPKEIRNTMETFSQLLPGFEHRFATMYGNDFGIATFVRPGLEIADCFERFVHLDDTRIPLPKGSEGAHSRKVLVTEISGVRIANFHGLWIEGYGKNDHPDRIVQSRRILEALFPSDKPTVLIGDFNLNPETESLKMLESAGFVNLVSKFGIPTTRTSLYSKREAFPFADYALATPNVPVADFRTLPDEVSDHAALFLELAE